MASQDGMFTEGNAIAFMVSAGLVYEIIAAACSSPQTAEINAKTRSKTLMKWVNLGLVQGAFFIVIAAMIGAKKGQAMPILAGGVFAGAVMGGCYWHANAAGKASDDPMTETL